MAFSNRAIGGKIPTNYLPEIKTDIKINESYKNRVRNKGIRRD
jgi:hypothetical protein